ncbi:MAG TPA: hypothetical protein VF712_12425 [Thermoleophilaceae bacterium]|jgi:hypothetical protein
MDVMPLAHGTGHWAVDIGIYLGPFLSIIAVVMFTDRRRRRQEEREAAADAAPADGAPAPGS